MGNGIVRQQDTFQANSLSGTKYVISQPVDSICSIFASKPDLKAVFIDFLRKGNWIERFHERADDITSYNPASELRYPQYLTPTGDIYGMVNPAAMHKKGIRAVSQRSVLARSVSSVSLINNNVANNNGTSTASTAATPENPQPLKKKHHRDNTSANLTNACLDTTTSSANLDTTTTISEGMITVDNIFLLVIAVAIPIFLQSEELSRFNAQFSNRGRSCLTNEAALSVSHSTPNMLLTPSHSGIINPTTLLLSTSRQNSHTDVTHSQRNLPKHTEGAAGARVSKRRLVSARLGFDSDSDSDTDTDISSRNNNSYHNNNNNNSYHNHNNTTNANTNTNANTSNVHIRRSRLQQSHSKQGLHHNPQTPRDGDASVDERSESLSPTMIVHDITAINTTTTTTTTKRSNSKNVKLKSAVSPVVNEDESLHDLLVLSTSSRDMEIFLLASKLSTSVWLQELFDYVDAFPYAITIASVTPATSSLDVTTTTSSTNTSTTSTTSTSTTDETTTTAMSNNGLEYRYCFINQAFETLTKWKRHQVLNQHCASILYHARKTEPAQIQRMHTSLHQRKSVKLSFTCQRADRSTFQNLMALRPVVNGEGDFVFVVGVHYDASRSSKMSDNDAHNSTTTTNTSTNTNTTTDNNRDPAKVHLEELMAVDSLLTLLAGLLI